MKKAAIFTVLVITVLVIGFFAHGFFALINAINEGTPNNIVIELPSVEPTDVPLIPSPVQTEEPSGTGIDSDLTSLIASLPTASEQDNGYERDMFGEGWLDTDNNGCDTRNDILARDLTDTTIDNQCRVLSGVLVDPYTGKTVNFVRGQQTSQEVPIDHIVPLSYAFAHGANTWNDAQREAFANDPLNLVATTQAPNSEKSDSGPSEWMPSNSSYTCQYITLFVTVVDIYDLTITVADQNTMLNVAGQC